MFRQYKPMFVTFGGVSHEQGSYENLSIFHNGQRRAQFWHRHWWKRLSSVQARLDHCALHRRLLGRCVSQDAV
jgi:hypothetical protein